PVDTPMAVTIAPAIPKPRSSRTVPAIEPTAREPAEAAACCWAAAEMATERSISAPTAGDAINFDALVICRSESCCADDSAMTRVVPLIDARRFSRRTVGRTLRRAHREVDVP